MNVTKHTALPVFVVVDAAERTYAHYIGAARTIKFRADETGPLLNAADVEEFRCDPTGFLGINEAA